MVIISDIAKNDLKQIHDFIKLDSEFYAKKVMNDIIRKFDDLERFPKLGSVVPEIKDNNVREIIVYSYSVIYQMSYPNIEILAIFHSKRNLKKKSFKIIK